MRPAASCRNTQPWSPSILRTPGTGSFPGEIIYLRMHGRGDWYSHDYSEEELREAAACIRDATPGKVYVFFNNDHAMLGNARRMREILQEG
jgi:uncharacterized protein YecE (DUF72 family)